MIARMNPTELKALARRIITNEIYVAWSQEALELSFGAMLALAGSSLKEDMGRIGLIYEEYNRAAPRSVNGYPMFFSMRLLHVNDVKYLREHLIRMQEALA